MAAPNPNHIPTNDSTNNTNPYVSRGGLKLGAALDRFELNVAGWLCVDLGCNVGGFTDCLLQRGAERVIAVDTAYGELAWKLRSDARVKTVERTNALHLDPAPLLSEYDKRVELVTIDLGWTPQRLALPAALRWGPRRIVTLIKQHYEKAAIEAEERAAGEAAGAGEGAVRGVAKESNDTSPSKKHRHTRILSEDEAEGVARRVVDGMAGLGLRVIDWIPSPILGGGSRKGGGNREYLALLEPVAGGVDDGRASGS